MILTSPALIVGGNVLAWQTRLMIGLSKLAPNLPLLPLLRDVLSRDPDVERQFAADPLCYNGNVRLGFARELTFRQQSESPL